VKINLQNPLRKTQMGVVVRTAPYSA
jgi:hypothetical protein